jgi:hypothetical protein
MFISLAEGPLDLNNIITWISDLYRNFLTRPHKKDYLEFESPDPISKLSPGRSWKCQFFLFPRHFDMICNTSAYLHRLQAKMDRI